MRFRCRHCNYVTEKKDVPARCPYCGNVGMVKEKGAQDFLNEASPGDDE
jgi:DNA-directed RNA polymerase subunit RPC12/RpoP